MDFVLPGEEEYDEQFLIEEVYHPIETLAKTTSNSKKRKETEERFKDWERYTIVKGKEAVLQPGESCVGSGSLPNWRFDQKSSRMALCEMILLDELPFGFIEKEGFKKFVSCISPQFHIPSRRTIKEDCVKLFLDRKEVLKSFFAKKSTGKVSISTECWTALNNVKYVCVTTHFIGKDWKLNKKIISFRKIAGYKGEEIADSIIESLNEWNLKSVLCCTMDNTSSNDKVIDCLQGYLGTQQANILGGKYFHLGCVAQTINLIVSESLEEIGMSVRRVREAVKWIKGSPKRTDRFWKCVKVLQIDCKKFFNLDVPTRWDSTHLMLEAVEPYKVVFNVFGSMDSAFVSDLLQKKHNDLPIGPPEEQDWVNVRNMMEYLKKFFYLTRLVSDPSYVTANLIFKEICDVFELISILENNADTEVALMASKMKKNVEKYWLETDILNPKMNKLLYIAAVLDPRQKMRHVERCLKRVYGNARANELASWVRDSMIEIFELYKKMLTPTPSSTLTQSQTLAPSQSSSSQAFDEEHFVFRDSCSFMVNNSDDDDDSDSSELTLYLVEKYKGIRSDSFDILDWWSKHCFRFPVLSEMAKDILAIPVSTCPSELAFSTEGRVLDEFRSSLSPSTIEALICAEDWLRSSSTKKKTNREDEDEEEQEEEFRKALSNVGLGV